MANKVFVSFRYKDGNAYKKEIVELLKSQQYTIDVSESEDRSQFTDDTIQKYLYNKIRDSTITIVILTPEAINYQRTNGNIDDWLYDEVSYSLKQYEGKRSNGVIAIYPLESENIIFSRVDNKRRTFNTLENLAKKNSCNVKDAYKVCTDEGWYDESKDCYVSFIPYHEFKNDMKQYIDNAVDKRNRIDQFKITKEL